MSSAIQHLETHNIVLSMFSDWNNNFILTSWWVFNIVLKQHEVKPHNKNVFWQYAWKGFKLFK